VNELPKVERLHPLDGLAHRALLGAVFPLERAHLVRIARENEAPVTVVTMLEGLPEGAYRSLADIQRSLGR
jgi:hypothetical protein